MFLLLSFGRALAQTDDANEPYQKQSMYCKAADGSIGWLFVPDEGKTNVKVDEIKMEIYLADAQAKTFQTYVYSNVLSAANFTDKLWSLSAMKPGIKSGYVESKRNDCLKKKLIQKGLAPEITPS